MENLILHIEYLLLHHDCVVVPGFGAFINVRQSAYYDEMSDLWYPMTREVRFNMAVRHDDGLLVNSIARKEQISFQDGRELLRKSLSRLSENLDADGEVTMGQLGILRTDGETISFIPRCTASRMAEMMGYLPATTRRQESISASDATISESEDASFVTPGDTTPESTATTREFDTRRNYYIPINKIFARTAACLLLVSAVALSVILPATDRRHRDQASVVPSVETILTVASESSHIEKTAPTQKAPNAATAEAATAEAATHDKATNDIEAKAHKSEEAKYHLIVATFRTAEESEKYIRSHSESEYTLYAVNTSSMSRVSARSSDSRDALLKLLNSPEFSQEFSQAWIWER